MDTAEYPWSSGVPRAPGALSIVRGKGLDPDGCLARIQSVTIVEIPLGALPAIPLGVLISVRTCRHFFCLLTRAG